MAPRPLTGDGAPRDRPDRCPGVLRPHAAADGLLVRVRPAAGRLDADALSALARAARLGNGIVELTSRANLQIRGLSEPVLTEVATALTASGLLRSRTHDRARNISAEPLVGRRPGSCLGSVAVEAVIDALDDGICADPALADLPARFLYAVEDGDPVGAVPGADVRLVATRDAGWHVVVGDRALAAAPADRAVAGALDAARAFLREGLGAWRIAEVPGAAATIAAAIGADVPVERVVQAEPEPSVGATEQADGRSAVAALAPLGRLPIPALDALATVSRTHAVRVSAQRTVVVLDVPRDRVATIEDTLADAGLVLTPGSGWAGLTACAGTGACASALADVRAAAAARATQRGPGAPREHWAGCGRRCGQTAGVRRAVVPRADGGWDVEEVMA
ncbi:precorrin-3B synthase [Paraconexibacter sp.]|uniref:precorrin-3B synthase n=1 Tax=Paraconexibacter sp. TaxID=2949640 RepID=UPI0035625BDF